MTHLTSKEKVPALKSSNKKETQKELSDDPNCLLRIKKNEKFWIQIFKANSSPNQANDKGGSPFSFSPLFKEHSAENS